MYVCIFGIYIYLYIVWLRICLLLLLLFLKKLSRNMRTKNVIYLKNNETLRIYLVIYQFLSFLSRQLHLHLFSVLFLFPSLGPCFSISSPCPLLTITSTFSFRPFAHQLSLSPSPVEQQQQKHHAAAVASKADAIGSSSDLASPAIWARSRWKNEARSLIITNP